MKTYFPEAVVLELVIWSCYTELEIILTLLVYSELSCTSKLITKDFLQVARQKKHQNTVWVE